MIHRLEANGANMPAIGFGTWTLRGEEAARLVKHAIDVGYVHIDTAAMYENEEAVGEGMRASGKAREDIFLTSKIWATDIADGHLQRSVEDSLKRLGFDYLDLALIHWPSKSIPLSESIKALNEVHSSGLARNIGVSNFPTALIHEAVELSAQPLACNQIEYHPCLNQDKVLTKCREHGMAVVSYCPLFRGGDIFDHDSVKAIAEAHEKTPAQVILRWHMQHDGVGAIPRSTNPARIRENLDVMGFALSDDEMATLSSMRSRNERICDFEFSPVWDPV